MDAILAITIFLIVVASVAILRTRRKPSTHEAEPLPPGVRPRSLFDYPGRAAEEARDGEEERKKLRAAALRARAERGDLDALNDAGATGDAALYRFVLDGLVGRASADAAELRALAGRVARGDGLRASPALAEMLLGEWRREPTRSSTAELLRVSALSDDATTFGLAVSEVMRLWEGGRLPGLSPEELRALFEGEYWLLSSEARRSGAGFVLKQKLADARRRLGGRARREPTNTGAGSPHEAPAQKERP